MTGAGMLSPVEVVDVEEEVPLKLLGGVGPHAVPGHHAALLDTAYVSTRAHIDFIITTTYYLLGPSLFSWLKAPTRGVLRTPALDQSCSP